MKRLLLHYKHYNIHRWVNEEEAGLLFDVKKHIMDRVRKKDLHIETLVDFKNALKYMMEQYIDAKSDFGINISGGLRVAINKRYENTKRIKGARHSPRNDSTIIMELQKVATQTNIQDWADMGMTQSEMGNDEEDVIESHEFVKNAIVIFDEALTAVMRLLKLDSLKRFYDSPDYKTLVHNMNKTKRTHSV